MRRLLIVSLVLLGSVAEAQSPALLKSVQEASEAVTRQAARVEATDEYKELQRLKDHLRTLQAALAEASKAETGSK